MRDHPNLDRAEVLHRLHLAFVEPLIIAARKPRRLRAFGIENLNGVPRGAVDLADGSDPCAAAIAGERTYLARYLSDRRPLLVSERLSGVPAIIDLNLYANFSNYEDRIRRHSKGGVLRQVRRARAHGFYCKTFYGDFYRRQRFAIETSKRFRSGLVLASLLRRPPASDFPDHISGVDIAAYLGERCADIARGMVLPEPPPPACALHWHIDWGVFLKDEGSGEALRERLVGYILLRRAGNIVRTAGFMGHGAYLSQNVMKLLFHRVMEWLLARADPRVIGVRYLLYGAIEHGNDGLFAWKRSFEFAPLRFVWSRQG